MEVTDAMRTYVEKKVARLGKFHQRLSEIEVVFDNQALEHKVEIIIKVDHIPPFVVNHAAEEMYACFDSALDKIERQLRRHKEKSRNRKGRTGAAEATVDFLESRPTEINE